MAPGAQMHRRTFRRLFEIPIVLAVITIAGLLSALLGDGIWNVLSWIALSIPLAVIIFYAGRPAKSMTISTDVADCPLSRADQRGARARRRGKGS